MSMEQDEAGLIARIVGGDAEQYALLIDRYKDRLYRYCFRIVRDEDEAADVVQETFIQVYGSLARFDTARPFSTWLFVIATRKAIDHVRRRHDVRLDEAELERIAGNLPDADILARHAELLEAINQLPRNEQEVVKMHYLDGRSYADIASQLGRPEGSVKGWLSRARKRLQEALL